MTDDRFSYVRIEVTVAAAIVGPDDRIVGSNMADATVAFGWRTETLPAGVTDERIQAALAQQMAGVLDAIQAQLMVNGWVAMGPVEDPLAQQAGDFVGEKVIEPHKVRLLPVKEARA